jgi:hypothetical protein
VVRPNRVNVHGCEFNSLVVLLLHGAVVLKIEASAGSTNSSEHGLSFYSLTISLKGANYADVTIGQTVAKDGRTIVSGPVSIH